MLLEGRSVHGQVELGIAYSELCEVRVGRLPDERVNGNSALLLLKRDGELVRVAPVGFGLLNELTELLAALVADHADEHERVEIVLPLRKGTVSQARELVAQGPPFDPASLGLTKHDVFVTEDEAVFVFEGRNVRRKLERLTRDPTLWQSGLAWRHCIGGRPRFSNKTHRPSVPPIFTWSA